MPFIELTFKVGSKLVQASDRFHILDGNQTSAEAVPATQLQVGDLVSCLGRLLDKREIDDMQTPARFPLTEPRSVK